MVCAKETLRGYPSRTPCEQTFTIRLAVHQHPCKIRGPKERKPEKRDSEECTPEEHAPEEHAPEEHIQLRDHSAISVHAPDAVESTENITDS